MLLRTQHKVDYVALHSGTVETSGAMAEKDDEDVFHDSFTDPLVAKKAELDDLQAEAEALEVEEKLTKLKLEVRNKKANIDQMNGLLSAPMPTQSDPSRSRPSSIPVEPQVPKANDPAYQFNQWPTDTPYSQYKPPLTSYDAAKWGDPQVQMFQPPPQAQLQYNTNPTSLRLDLNPQSYLFTPSTRTAKYRSVLDFIPRNARHSRETPEEHEMIPGRVTLSITGGRSLKLESVTPAQWVAANANILADILKKSPSIDPCLVLDYMSYTSKIGELASKKTWKSVVLFDDEYREKQHEFGFRWGSDTPHTSDVNLVTRDPPKDDKSKRSKSTSHSDSSSNDRPTQTPVCRNWNKEETCSRLPCKFQHICEWCRSSAHPRVKHDQASKTSDGGKHA